MNCPNCNFPLINGKCPMCTREKERLRNSKIIVTLISIIYISIQLLIKYSIISENNIYTIIIDKITLIMLISLVSIYYKKYNKDSFFKIYLIIFIIVFFLIFLKGLRVWL